MCVFYSLRIENVLQRDREMVEQQGKRKRERERKKERKRKKEIDSK